MPKSLTQLMMDVEMLLDDKRPNRLEGWCSVEKAHRLVAIVLALRPTATVEIGVFGGRSLIPMAMAHAFNNHGIAIGIDPWSKEASLDGMEGVDKEWWDKLDHEVIYTGFMNASARLRADGWMRVHRCTSDDALGITYTEDQAQCPSPRQAVPTVIDLLHIDGNHGPQAVRDVLNYVPIVRTGGIVIMDDIDWAAPAVAAARELGLQFLYKLDTGAVFQK